MGTVRTWLQELFPYQEDILLVYHPERDSTWADRALYLSDDYSQTKAYNHRTILECEVVIEYDDRHKDFNRRCADKVCDRLMEDGIGYSKWSSGNKSTHVHTLVDIGNVRNRKLLKRVFMRHYGTFYYDEDTDRLYTEETRPEGLSKEDRVLPDLQLDANNHLIRAEHGVHEKTGEQKSLISRSAGYPVKSQIPQVVWDKYEKAYQTVLNRKATIDLQDVSDHPGIKFIKDAAAMRELGDGRKRALYHLITVLKHKYDNPKDLIEFLQDWYSYCSGSALSDGQIRYHVYHNIKKGYAFSLQKFNDFLEEIGREDLILEE